MATKRQKQELNQRQHVPATNASALLVSEFLIPPSERILFALTSQEDQFEEIAFTNEAILTVRTVSSPRTNQQGTSNHSYKAVDRYDYASLQFSPVQYEDLGDQCFRIAFWTIPIWLDGGASFSVRMRHDEAVAKIYCKAVVVLLRETTRDFYDTTRRLDFHQAIALIGEYGVQALADHVKSE
ncbi:hypothetical protein Gpo141_00002888 [Globisporangium polare]